MQWNCTRISFLFQFQTSIWLNPIHFLLKFTEPMQTGKASRASDVWLFCEQKSQACIDLDVYCSFWCTFNQSSAHLYAPQKCQKMLGVLCFDGHNFFFWNVAPNRAFHRTIEQMHIFLILAPKIRELEKYWWISSWNEADEVENRHSKETIEASLPFYVISKLEVFAAGSQQYNSLTKKPSSHA